MKVKAIGMLHQRAPGVFEIQLRQFPALSVSLHLSPSTPQGLECTLVLLRIGYSGSSAGLRWHTASMTDSVKIVQFIKPLKQTVKAS